MGSGLDLGKQVGPLPMGAWLGVVAGGLGIAWYVNKNAGKTPAASVGDGLTEPGSGAGGGQFIDSPPTVNPPAPTGYETNDQWARAAILFLLSEAKNPNTATLAISRYIAEQPLNNEEHALVGLAIAKLGPPPFLPINPPDAPPVTPPPTNPPVTPPPGKPPVKPPPASVTLTAPKNLRTWGKGPSVLTVPLQWEKVTGAASYRVYRKGVATNVNTSIDTKTTVGGLRPGTSYTFHVRAVDKKGKLGPSSASKTFKTKGK